jgi:hypothetical protein
MSREQIGKVRIRLMVAIQRAERKDVKSTGKVQRVEKGKQSSEERDVIE